MGSLTREEILSGLKRLGINTTSELNSFSREYKTSTLQNKFPYTLSARKFRRNKKQHFLVRKYQASQKMENYGSYMGMEKRICKRIPVNVELRYYCWNALSWKKLYSGTITSVSEKGMFINTENTYFPCNSLLEMFISFKEQVIYIPANLISIIWRRMLPDDSFDGIGIELSNPPQDFLEFINSL